jgi:sulfur-carrier protein
MGSPEATPIHAVSHKPTLLLASQHCNGMVTTMVTVEFAPSLQRHKPCPVQQVAAGTLAQTLEAAFAAEPGLRHYVLDDQGHIRKHVAVFINRDMHLQRQQLQRPLHSGDKVLVIQCLTGG